MPVPLTRFVRKAAISAALLLAVLACGHDVRGQQVFVSGPVSCAWQENVITQLPLVATTVNTSTGSISASNTSTLSAGQTLVFTSVANAAYSANTVYYVAASPAPTSTTYALSATPGGSAIVPASSTMTATAYPAWPVPANVSFAWLSYVGGGGQGGGGYTSATGGGGGGGASAITDFGVPVIAGSYLILTIGAGGSGASGNNSGNIGATTTVTGPGLGGPPYILPIAPYANGGGKGVSGTVGGTGGGGAPTASPYNEGAGGTAGTGSTPAASGSFSGVAGIGWVFNSGDQGGGGGGQSAGSTAGASRCPVQATVVPGGTSGTGDGGGGGCSALGIGGAGGTNGGASPSSPAANNYGAGGGGGAQSQSGAAGSQGVIIARWCS